jgi:aldehyde dehydrogenase (NAD+)
VGVVGHGNRKDIRNAVEAARKALPGWSGPPHTSGPRFSSTWPRTWEPAGGSSWTDSGRAPGFRPRPRPSRWSEPRAPLHLGGLADKVDGRVHRTPFRNVTLAMVEPVGVVGIAAPDAFPLLGFVSAVAPAVALGNTVVVVPSSSFPLAATDLYQVLDTSDLPGGVVNVVTGLREELVPVLADHDDVDAVWSFGDAAEAREVELRSVGNLKRTWTDGVRPGGGVAPPRRWENPAEGEGEPFVEHATRIKNIWVPYGA